MGKKSKKSNIDTPTGYQVRADSKAGEPRCWNCWSPSHDCVDCPEPPVTAACRERIRLHLQLAPPEDPRYYTIISAQDLCANCWMTNTHGAGGCNRPAKSTAEREMIRVKMGAAKTEYWKAELRNAGVEELCFKNVKVKNLGLGDKSTWEASNPRLMTWIKEKQQAVPDIATEETEEESASGEEYTPSESSAAGNSDNDEEDASESEHEEVESADEDEEEDENSDSDDAEAVETSHLLLQEVQGLRADVNSGFDKLTSEMARLTEYLMSAGKCTEANNNTTGTGHGSQQHRSTADLDRIKNRLLAMEAMFGRQVIATSAQQ